MADGLGAPEGFSGTKLVTPRLFCTTMYSCIGSRTIEMSFKNLRCSRRVGKAVSGQIKSFATCPV